LLRYFVVIGVVTESELLVPKHEHLSIDIHLFSPR